jgi:lipoprotein-releasing system ATP-binding protein
MSEVLAFEAVAKAYNPGTPAAVTVLDGAELRLGAGEVVALVAPSGAGKSTLLHIAGLLDTPSGGTVRLMGEPTDGLSDAERTRLRRDTVGFVYQFHHLLPEFSALENVVLPQRAAGQARAPAEARAAELLAAVGLSERLAHRPAELSGGEQQRVLRLVRDTGLAALVATHNPDLAARMDRTLRLQSGRVVEHRPPIHAGVSR